MLQRTFCNPNLSHIGMLPSKQLKLLRNIAVFLFFLALKNFHHTKLFIGNDNSYVETDENPSLAERLLYSDKFHPLTE